MDKHKVDVVINDILEALKPLEEKHGVKIKRANATYTDSYFRLPLDVADVTEDGVALTKEARELRDHGHLLGIKAPLGTEFKHGGHNYTLIGISTRSSKYPIIADRDGKTFKLGKSFIPIINSFVNDEE